MCVCVCVHFFFSLVPHVFCPNSFGQVEQEPGLLIKHFWGQYPEQEPRAGLLASTLPKVKRLTQLLLLSEPHDGHGLHGFIEHLIILGGRDGHKAIGEECVVVEAFQKQVI